MWGDCKGQQRKIPSSVERECGQMFYNCSRVVGTVLGGFFGGRDLDFHNIYVEIDSASVLQLIEENVKGTYCHVGLISAIHGLLVGMSKKSAATATHG